MRKAPLLSGESNSDKQPMCLQLTSGSGEQTFKRKRSYKRNEETWNLSLLSLTVLYHGYVNTCRTDNRKHPLCKGFGVVFCFAKSPPPGSAALDTPSVFCSVADIPKQGSVSALLRLNANSQLLLYEEVKVEIF